jgi:hypothetical protein
VSKRLNMKKAGFVGVLVLLVAAAVTAEPRFTG